MLARHAGNAALMVLNRAGGEARKLGPAGITGIDGMNTFSGYPDGTEEGPVRIAARRMPPASDTVRTAAPRLDVWRLRLDAKAPLGADLAVLDEAELRRAADMLFPQERRQFVMGRAFVRRVLAHHTGLEPGAIPISTGRNGKPALADAAEGIDFNLSHSRSGYLLGVIQGLELGVDLEERHHVIDRNELARAYFTRQEFGALQACRNGLRDDLFLRIWTRKEAVLKAVGAGLSEAPNRFEVDADLRVQTIRYGSACKGEQASYCIVDLSDDSGIAAVAVRGHDGLLVVQEHALDELTA